MQRLALAPSQLLLVALALVTGSAHHGAWPVTASASTQTQVNTAQTPAGRAGTRPTGTNQAQAGSFRGRAEQHSTGAVRGP